MRRIYKFPLQLEDAQRIQMPSGARPIKAGKQEGLVLWAIVDPASPQANYRVDIVPTGKEPPEDKLYVDTVFDGPFVWHVFIRELDAK